LYPSTKKHDTDKYEKERTKKSQQRYPFSSIKLAHRPSQALRDQVHAGNYQQGHKESECKTKNNCPGKRPPEYNTVAAKKYFWIKMLE
jgi:hypothetical protein